MTKKAAIISFSALAVLIIFLLLDFNSFSIVLWQNGFSGKDVYQEVAINNDSSIDHYILAANDGRIGILCMKQGVFGIWQKQDISMIADKNTANHDVISSNTRMNWERPGSPNSYIDTFYAGIINKTESNKIYNLKQQRGCLFSADIYQLSDNKYLVFFHVTNNSSNDKNFDKTQDIINSIHFEKLK